MIEDMLKRATFEVSLKVLLRDKEQLLISKSMEGDIDLPGGRIDEGEEIVAIKEVVKREVREELGENVQFRLGTPLLMYRALNKEEGRWVFCIVFDAEYLGGEITLSEEHQSYQWVDRRSYQVSKDDFHAKDVEKYESFRNYFDSLNG